MAKVGFNFKPHLQADVHELFVHLFTVIEDEAYKSSCSVSFSTIQIYYIKRAIFVCIYVCLPFLETALKISINIGN